MPLNAPPATSGHCAAIEGLGGTPDQLAGLARRYRVAYSVVPAHNGQPEQVSYSALVYVFDRRGNARLLISGMATTSPDIAGTASDLRRVLKEPGREGIWNRLIAWL